MKIATLSGLAIASAVVATTSGAAGQQVALSRFEPAERGSRFFVADSLELHHGEGVRPAFAFGLATSYAYRARTFGTKQEGEQSRLVEHALYLHPGGSAVVAPGARFALDLPIAVQSGQETNLAGHFYGAPGSPRLGDLRMSFDLRLLGPASRDVDGIALAAGVTGWLPTGSGSDYAGDDATRFGAHLAAAARFGSILVSARAGYMYRRDADFGGSRVGPEFNAVLGAAYADDRWTIGPELHGATLIYDPLTTAATPVEVLLAAHRRLGPHLPLRVGVGIGTSLVSGLGASHFRALFSIEWAPAAPISDRDGDGVPDDEDACPDVAGVASGPEGVRGCPGAPQDRDHDGIIDPLDACPDDPGVPSANPRKNGCPIPAPTPTETEREEPERGE